METGRYLSQIAVNEIFPAGQRKMESASVVVIGMGGTGSAAAELLARMGIGRIIIVDNDTIEMSNLNRQALYKEKDIGLKKVTVAERELREINGSIEVEAVDQRLNFSNAVQIMSRGDLTIDGTDNFTARNVINRTSIALNKPWIFSAVEGTFGYVKAIIPGVTSCLSCMGYPTEGEGVACTAQGVVPTAVRLISSIATTLALRVLLGENVDGSLTYFDVWKQSLERVEIVRDEKCPVCGVNGNGGK